MSKNYTIADMKKAYVFFNARLFDGRLPPLRGRPRVELEATDIPEGSVADCGKEAYGFLIRFSRKHFGSDLKKNLATLVHEMAHVDLWRDTKGGHDAPWRAWMFALGFETDDRGRHTPIEDGQFVKARDEWIKGWKEGSGESPSGPPPQDDRRRPPVSAPAAHPAATSMGASLVGLGLLLAMAAIFFGAVASAPGERRASDYDYDGGYNARWDYDD